ncbi:MAG: hypothetical protein JXQ72_04780 [Anaerolineae bacterium]|nr:hypothetical protein [Anaerolineae bacterium]
MPDALTNALPYITGILVGLALLLFVIAVRLFRRSRTDVFWRRRREAGQRGWRVFVLAFTLLVFSGLACGATLLVNLLSDDDQNTEPTTTELAGPDSPEPPRDDLTPIASTPTVPADQSPAANNAADAGSPESVVVVITATPGSTPTHTPFPTFTPESSPLESSVTPLPNAQIVITALDDRISDGLTPVNPRNVFAAGTERIYLFVEFRGMAQGVLWKRRLYRDGQQVDGNDYLWGLEETGSGYFFFGHDTGFEAGQYEIRLFIGSSDEPVNTMTFTVSP